MATVHIPSPLLSYTGGAPRVEAEAESLKMLVEGLDVRFPGLRFRIVDEQGRIREHIRFFVDGDLVRDLSHPLATGQEVHILCALSGG